MSRAGRWWRDYDAEVAEWWRQNRRPAPLPGGDRAARFAAPADADGVPRAEPAAVAAARDATEDAVKFFAPGVPAPKGSARAIMRGGKPRLIASGSNANRDAQQAWATSVGWAARAAARGRVLTGPVRVAIVFVFARPASHTRAQRSEAAHTVKPDVDKVLRSTLDALSGVAFVDDQQVCDVRGVKRYAAEGEQVGAWIEVQSLAVEAAEEMSA